MDGTFSIEIINPVIENDQDISFHLFPVLPLEIRLRIWEVSVVRHRLLEIEVAPPSPSAQADQKRRQQPSQARYSRMNALCNVVSGGREYVATVQHGRFMHSKLLRVNREARRVALRFYRVHIPCWLRAVSRQNSSTSSSSSSLSYHAHPNHPQEANSEMPVLYLNPEYDIVYARAQSPAAYTLVDFLHDVRAHDPRGVGTLHLAMDVNTMGALHYALFYDGALQDPADPARLSLTESLRCLRSVVWMAYSHAGRAVMGPLEDFRGAGVRFVHSLPVRADTVAFDFLESRRGGDLRPAAYVKRDLQWVMTATRDPRQMRLQWRDVLQRLGLRSFTFASTFTQTVKVVDVNVEEKVLFAYEPPQWLKEQYGHIYDRASACRFLVDEQG